MGKIMDIIAKETSGISYNSHKYLCDSGDKMGIDYDDNRHIEWKEYGETAKHTKPINLKKDAKQREDYESIFKFFLDGSRHSYKVNDMAYGKNVYPIVGGQVGVGCCVRIDKQIKPWKHKRHLLLSFPDKAFSSTWDSKNIKNELLKKINNNLKPPKIDPSLIFSDILIYNTNKDDKFMNKGIAMVHEFMVEREKELVKELAKMGK